MENHLLMTVIRIQITGLHANLNSTCGATHTLTYMVSVYI